MDARRLELYELLKPTLGEDPAQKLVLALPPQPERLVTTEHVDGRFSELEGRIDGRFREFEARMDARFERLENVLTRRMVAILGTWTVIVASAFAWAGALLR